MANRLNPYKVATKEFIKFRGIFGELNSNNMADEYVEASDNLTSFRLRQLEGRSGQETTSSYSGDIHSVREARTVKTLCEGGRLWAEAMSNNFTNKPSAYVWRSGYIGWDADDLPEVDDLVIQCSDLEGPDYVTAIPEMADEIITPETWGLCFEVTCQGLWDEIGSIEGYTEIEDNADNTFPLSGIFTRGFDGCYQENELDLTPGDYDDDGDLDIPVPDWELPDIPDFVLPGWPEFEDPELPPVDPELLECLPETLSLSTSDLNSTEAGGNIHFLVSGYTSQVLDSGESSVSWTGYPQSIQKGVIQYGTGASELGEQILGVFASDYEFLDLTGGISLSAKTEGGTNVVVEYNPNAYPSQTKPTNNAIILEKTRALTGANSCEKSGKISYSITLLPGFAVGTIISGKITRFAGTAIEKRTTELGYTYYVMVSNIVSSEFKVAIGEELFVVEKEADYSTTSFDAGYADISYEPMIDFIAGYGNVDAYDTITDLSDSESVTCSVGWQITGLSTQWIYSSSKFDSISKTFNAPVPADCTCLIKIPYKTTENSDKTYRLALNGPEKIETPTNEDCFTDDPPLAVQLYDRGTSYWYDECDSTSDPHNNSMLLLGSGSNSGTTKQEPSEINYSSSSYLSSGQTKDSIKVNTFLQYTVPYDGTDYMEEVSGSADVENLDEIIAIYKSQSLAHSLDGDIRVKTIMESYSDTIDLYNSYYEEYLDRKNFVVEYKYQENSQGWSGGAIVYPPQIALLGGDDQELWDFPVRYDANELFSDRTTDQSIILEASLEPGEEVTVDLPIPETAKLPDLASNPYVQEMSDRDYEIQGLMCPNTNPPDSWTSGYASGDIEILVLSYD